MESQILPESYWPIIAGFFLGALVFLGIGLWVSYWASNSRPNREKNEPYESGEEPLGSPWAAFHARYYLVALLFVVFEADLIFLFPWTVALKDLQNLEFTLKWRLTLTVIVFISMLVFALIWAWKKGFLDWMQPQVEAPNSTSIIPEERYYERWNKKA